MALHTRILIGLLAGAVLGITANLTVGGSAGLERVISLFTDPIGRIWLNALLMVVIPLVISTLATGVAGLQGPRELEEAIRQRRLAMVDVRDDREIPDVCLIHLV